MRPSPAGLGDTPCLRHLDTLEAAARMMRATGARILPVTQDGRFVGTISDRDIVIRMVAEGLDGWLTRVRDFMTAPALSCRTDDDPQSVLLAMIEAQVDTVPLIDARDRVIGMITAEQIRRAHSASAAEVGSHIDVIAA
ncbi:CBS domain-containing protein [Pelagerythrobacter rhizovicinus]|uniref:CBS domain-containing protein n=1 Tax=Pelagerythrobacter rhizovicinus TaxID=2268576 RepID=A0A4Q2KJM8_9SPHN|nr:CBS domain-containing protein [Pelagerythrobacter rhizovicinus]RXZ65434.1 CBS domain-containing protein [Pelagerythrobacter rhizovicinus]